MIGFLVGTACLIGLVGVLSHGHYRFHAYRGRFRRRWPLHLLFDELDTSPGQEKAIRGAVDDLLDDARMARREVRKSRSDLADVLNAEHFDRARLDDLAARQQVVLSDLWRRAVDTLETVHSVLDDRQRKRLAEMVESGPGYRFMRHAGPYRTPC